MILLSYAKFPVFNSENRNAEFFGGLGLFHSVHIAVERLGFRFGQVHFFDESVGFRVIGGAVSKAISGVGNVVLVVFKIYLSVVCNLSAEV